MICSLNLYAIILESLTEYFHCVLAGLAGSPHMISCTLLALSRLVCEFHGVHYLGSLSLTLQPVMCICADMLGTSLIKKLLSGTLVFLSSKNKEVVRSTLVLVKITIRVLPPNELAPHVEDMVSFPLPSLPPSLSSFFTSISSPLSPLLGEEHFELGWR